MRSLRDSFKYTLVLTGIILFAACKKQADYVPNDGQIAYVNFYNAADGLLQNGAVSAFRLQINDAFPGGRQPEYEGSNGSFQYPATVSGSVLAVDFLSVPSDVTYGVVYWLPVKAEPYNFKYDATNYNATTQVTDELGTIARSNEKLDRNSFTTQYFTESLESDTSYKILNVPVERKGTPGKVRLQIVNLSPDAGPLEIYREDSNGAKITEGLPASVASGTFSTYAEIDTTGAYKNLGQLLIKVRRSGTIDALMTASVPAISNSSFTLVLQGFAAPAIRRLKSAEATGFTQVTVSPDLRFKVRRVY